MKDVLVAAITFLEKSWDTIRQHWWAISLSLFVLFSLPFVLPHEIFLVLHVEALWAIYSPILGFLAYATAVVTVCGFVCSVIICLRDRHKRAKLMQKLTSAEKEHLAHYLREQSQTWTFDLYDGVVAGLVKKGILYKPDTKANKAGEQDYNMEPWAYEFLKKHRDLIEPEARECCLCREQHDG